MEKIENIEETHKNRWIILGITLTITFMSTLDSSIVNVALPTISHNLGVTLASVAWVVSIYLIVITSLVIFFGKLADLTGKSRIFIFGISVFTIGSLFCGISNSFVILLIARVLQSMGAAAAMSTNQGIIAEVFHNKGRGRALGMSGSAVALGNTVGPVLGGFIVAVLSWHYIFLINIPIGIIAFIMAMKYLPKDSQKLHNKKALDGFGFVAFALTMVFLFSALSEGEIIGYNKLIIIAMFIVAIISFIIFYIREKRTSLPMLDLNIFKNKLFSLSVFCAAISFSAVSCYTLILPFYLQELRQMSPEICGLIMLGFPLVLLVVSPISGHISDKIGSEVLTLVGLTAMSAMFILMSIFYHQNTAIFIVILFIGMMGLGTGMFQSPNTSLIMSTVPKNKLGIAGSINALARNVGMAFGVSLTSILLWSFVSLKAGYKVLTYIPENPGAFVYGMHWVFIIEAGICMIGVVLTAIRLYGRKNIEKEGVENHVSQVENAAN
ncbi:MAG: MFS transporter [Oscillospiraceae bacterium]|nr:MFS transporter [Oscillospiraceae bacterium]